MKLSLSTWSLHRLFFERRIKLISMLALGKSLGFDGVELEDIWFPETGNRFLKALKHEARKAGVTVS
ncbi:MAG: hypothetical protein HY562_08135, partial [Ignavibacteriales bacterium]|nr:hypothetical protein [Ignavibacteriales bacterium]